MLAKKEKVKKSFLAGAAFVFIALLFDAFVFGASNVLEASGLTPLLASLLIVLSLAAFNAFSGLKKPYVVVGVAKEGKAKELLPLVKEVALKPVPTPAPTAAPVPTPIEKQEVRLMWKEAKEAREAKEAKPKPKPKPAAAPAPLAPLTIALPVEKKGFFAKLFSRKPGPAKPVEKPVAKKPIVPEKFEKVEKPGKPLPKWIEAKKREEEKRAKEVEVETILKDLIGEGKIVEKAKGEGVHRLYLKKRLERAREREAGGAAKAAEKEKEKEELNALFQDVYTQLKPSKEAVEKRGGVEKIVGAKPPPQPKHVPPGKAIIEEKPLSMADLFGEEAKPTPAVAAAPTPAEKPSRLFAELEAISAGKEEKEAKEAKEAKPRDVEFVKMQAAPGIGCPNCGSRNARIVFCPYCGNGMCANCTPSLKPSPEAFVYTCPKCGEEIAIKKKAPSPAAALA